MDVHEYNAQYKVYHSAEDRFVKKINDHIYEVYHIQVITNESSLNIVTINFLELTDEVINNYLNNCGLKYLKDKKRIVQKHDETKIVEERPELIRYVLADKLAISGYSANMNYFEFDDAKDLNQLFLEHNIPYQYDNATLRSV